MRLLLVTVLIAHSAFSFYAIYREGYWGAFPPFQDIWTTQIFSDLVVSIGLLWLFLYRDAVRRNKPKWRVFACGVGIIFAGSIAPLIYLLIEKDALTNS